MERKFIPHTDKYSCIYAESIETDYDVISGHSYYKTECRRSDPDDRPDRPINEACLNVACKHRVKYTPYVTTNRGMRIRATDWLTEETIKTFIKPVSVGDGTIEEPPVPIAIQGLRMFYADSEVIIQVNRTKPIDTTTTINNGYTTPDDLIKLLDTAIRNDYDTIEIMFAVP